MSNENLGASFSIDVTDLKAGLLQANRMIRESESEFKAAAAGMDNWTESQDGLTAKIKSLNSITEIQRKKVDALNSEYDRLIADGLDPTSKQATELRTKINNETAALKKNEAELKQQTQALEDLEKGTKDAAAATDDMGDKFGGLKAAGGAAVGAIAGVGAACVAGVGAFLGLAESTKETQTQMAQLEASFSKFGEEIGVEQANDTLYELQGILGDVGRSVEASNLLAKMSKNEADLEANTRILTGVFAQYGESIPTEGLAEGMQATAEMGSVQGVLADALEWQGVNLDEYNEKLASMTSAEERAAYIQSTLTDLYGESADAYRENNAALIESNEAELRLQQTMADLGAIALPIMTELKNLASDLLMSITPFVSLIGEGLTGALNGADGAADSLAEGLSGILTTALNKIVEMIPFLIETILSILPILISSILEKVPDILQLVIDIVIQIINALSELLPQIVAAVVELVPQLVNALIAAIPQLLEAAIQLLMSIVNALPTIISNLVAALPSVIRTVITALLNAIPLLIEAAIQLFNAIILALPTIIQALTENIPVIITTIIDGLLTALPLVLEGAITLLMAIIEAIPTIISVLYKEIPNLVLTVVEALLSRVPSLYRGAIKLFMQIVEAIPSIIKELVTKIPQVVSTIVEGLKNGISKVKTIGKDLIRGLWNGIKDMTSWIKDKISGFGESVLGGLKDFFGIHSPSRVMADEVGKNLALGIGQGFTDNIGNVNDEITSAMNFENTQNQNNAQGRPRVGGVNVYQYNTFAKAHTRFELYKSKQQAAAAVRLATSGA